MSESTYNLSRLRQQIRPFKLHFSPRLRSTNDHAATLRRSGKLFAPALVLTSNQTAGRGRGANRWFSTKGCITATFVLKADARAPHEVPLVAGLAVRDAVAQLCAVEDIQLKWPNDILHQNRKLAGLLCERVDHADLIGLGLNVNLNPARAPAALCPRITSLSHITGQSLDMTDVLVTIARELHRAISRRGDRLFAETIRRYNDHHALAGKRITVIGPDSEPAIQGTCQGLDATGKLLLKSRHQLHRIIAGQIQLDTRPRK